MERPYSEAADVSSPTDLEFGSLANSLALLLEAAKSELKHDQEAAKTSLATASSILQSEIEGRSGANFSRSFKQAFGEPLYAYIVRRRLEEACHLMLTSSASLAEIALSVGFSDQAHLSKLFRQAIGQTPSNWRRERETLWRR